MAGSGITEPGPTLGVACATQTKLFKKIIIIATFNFLIPTLVLSSQFMISVCTLILSTFHQCNTTEIKPQAKISPQFCLFNSQKPSDSGELHPPASLLYNS